MALVNTQSLLRVVGDRHRLSHIAAAAVSARRPHLSAGILRLPSAGRQPPSLLGASFACAEQRRWNWWDLDASRKKRDKPAFTSSQHVFVSGQVPVVMLETVRGLGRKGEIVSVRRGYARHNLVPRGLALFGTWENIDSYADPALADDPSLKSRVAAVRGRLPFDWVDEIHLQFVRWAREDSPTRLLEPVTVWELLEVLSDSYELDLLPVNLELPEEGLEVAGMHEVRVRIPFRNPEVAAGRYAMRVEIVSQQSQEAELRREEMARAVEQSRRFELPQMALGGGAEESDSDAEE